MARALFLGLPLHGHTNPTLPLVRELGARGDEVVYYSSVAFADRIREAGAGFRAYRNRFLTDMRQLPGQLEALGWLLTRTSGEVLDEELAGWRELRPDYVIADSVAPWGQWAGEILDVPVVTSISTFAFNRQVAAYAFRHGVRPKSVRLALSKLRHTAKACFLMRELRRRFGAEGPGIVRSVAGTSGLNIVYTSRLFQPCEESFDEAFQFVGPAIEERSARDDFPWERLEHPVVIYVSMGTLFDPGPAFYAGCFAAFGRMDCQVVLSAGAGSLDSAGASPDNFIVRPRVPQLDVLRRASVFVTHGGMNSVSEGLYYGVPLVVVPQMSEQAIVGRRVEELGAGVYVAKEDATADSLRAGVERVSAEGTFREAAARVRASFLEAGGVGRAAEAIFAARSEVVGG
jgi:MGT family glycosyltransferase